MLLAKKKRSCFTYPEGKHTATVQFYPVSTIIYTHTAKIQVCKVTVSYNVYILRNSAMLRDFFTRQPKNPNKKFV